MSDRSMQIKVGALILVALALLVGFILLLGRFNLGAERTYFVEVHDSGSMLRGAPVKIAGVRAGRVEEVVFLAERGARRSEPLAPGEPEVNVRVRISVDEKMATTIRRDSEFYITTQGVLGEKYMEIVPGSDHSPQWPEGAYIRGQDPARIDLIFAKVNSILARVDQALTGSGDLNLSTLVDSLIKLTQEIDQLVVESRPRVNAIVGNVERATADAAELAEYLRVGVGSAENVAVIVQNVRRLTTVLARDVEPLVSTARRTMETVDGSVRVVRDLLDRNGARIDKALANLEPISENARQVMRDAAAVTGGLALGRGTVGQLIVDQEIYDDLKEMLRDLKRHPWKMLWRE